MTSATENKYCSLDVLRNESDVEQAFVRPLLNDLGYEDAHIATKATISQENIGKEKKTRAYRPDFICSSDRQQRHPVLIIDAKGPNAAAEEGVTDAQLYASVIRRRMKGNKPEQYCLGTNGNRLVVKHYDSNEVIHSLAFADFWDDNPRFKALADTIRRDRLAEKAVRRTVQQELFEFSSVAPTDLPAIFETCHRAIWKAEKRSPASAFYEFAKVMFVKIDEDRRIHDYLSSLKDPLPSGMVPRTVVRFSSDWIDRMEESTDNPIDSILFAQLTKNLEAQIAKGEKKRIFEPGEGIKLAPTTIKVAVTFLQHLDLFAVDEDLNGRLFETFLTATMRGEALGQFFTPRSVVKFMVKIARLQATPWAMDTVLDGCCGSGGFLIEAMADMATKIIENQSLAGTERERLLRNLRMENLWGIDAGTDPQMARIARLNMLLHRDGGSRIYSADALDKQLRGEKGLPLTTRLELDELSTVA